MITLRLRLAISAQCLSRQQRRLIKVVGTLPTMDEPIVTVKQGKLRGCTVQGVLGSSYIAFHEIPFAAPPVGKLRFQDPKPPASWTGIRDASKYVGKACTQVREVAPFDVFGDEDCLYLNVFTNSISDCARKPVMFWIHGGSFIVGSASYNVKRPDYLIKQDVVIVMTNYRLGAFGFLNLGHRAAPGNQGLKDVIAALQWVKDNIANFGGDPDNVTIFGASAGGILVHALTVSPCAQGLFHKAIIQSGVLQSPVAMNQSVPARSFKLAAHLGSNSTDPVQVVEFLRTIDAKDIVKGYSAMLTKEEEHSLCLQFGLNTDNIAEYSVLPQPYDEILSTVTDIPVMVGYTSHEFMMFVADKSEKMMKMYDMALPIFVKRLAETKNLSEADTDELLRVVRNRYFGGQPLSPDKINEFIVLMSDIGFGVGTCIYVEGRVKMTRAPTYFYVYTYVGNEETHTDLLVKRVATGASHVDELSYLFYSPYVKIKNTKPPAAGTKDRIMIERLTRMWTNFAKTGNPTPCHDEFIATTWEPVTQNELKYLNIGDESKLLIMEPHVLSSK
ncbi:para-nitrobenzyl esterase-like isoform X1 [Hylaeus volcanicus]|uniref:para-nitrobenzyl esterase-like isoform X1 n=2 Tax=Hylaeus volcanicus TaxID=313075 RepID=UPI0023B7E41C|nr:para-nitrobenzyl esterase-like isoform X1 [Hylaeus volcanicus]